MEKLKEYKLIIILVLVVLGGAFYWYEWRPSQIKKECNGQAYFDSYTTLKAGEFFANQSQLQDRQKKLYDDCLRYNGI